MKACPDCGKPIANRNQHCREHYRAALVLKWAQDLAAEDAVFLSMIGERNAVIARRLGISRVAVAERRQRVLRRAAALEAAR